MTTREKLIRAVLDLPDEELDGALDYVVQRREDPMIAAFRDAPEDDEPLTPEEEAALAEADADIEAGRLIPFEEIKREHGLA
jgi:predicted transcriptional regulator